MPTFLNHGAFADVIALDDGTVIKAFRRQRHASRPDDWTVHDQITRRLFRTEAESYERLLPHSDLQIYLPHYYGRIDPTEVPLPNSGKGEHLKDCGFRLERLSGEEDKMGVLPDELQAEIDVILERIAEILGNVWVYDASAFYPGKNARFTLIDFGFWRDLADVTTLLEEEGYLSEHVLKLTGLWDCTA
jgi:hypothetical protein